MNRRGFFKMLLGLVVPATVPIPKSKPNPVRPEYWVEVGPVFPYEITPNEVRALHGREPYLRGGDDPLNREKATCATTK